MRRQGRYPQELREESPGWCSSTRTSTARRGRDHLDRCHLGRYTAIQPAVPVDGRLNAPRPRRACPEPRLVSMKVPVMHHAPER
jgi:hypothetical protein